MSEERPSELRRLLRWASRWVKERLWVQLGLGAAVALVIWVIAGVWLPDWLVDDPELQGVIGDRFGAANALIAALGLAFLAVSVLYQARELSDVLKEHQSSNENMRSARVSQVVVELVDEVRTTEVERALNRLRARE